MSKLKQRPFENLPNPPLHGLASSAASARSWHSIPPINKDIAIDVIEVHCASNLRPRPYGGTLSITLRITLFSHTQLRNMLKIVGSNSLDASIRLSASQQLAFFATDSTFHALRADFFTMIVQTLENVFTEAACLSMAPLTAALLNLWAAVLESDRLAREAVRKTARPSYACAASVYRQCASLPPLFVP